MNYAVGILIFACLGAVFLIAAIFINHLLVKRVYHPLKIDPYECGEVVKGEAFVRFDIRFYIYALAFIVFETEVVFFFPWAVVLKKIKTLAFFEMLIFLFILIVGLYYVWKKEDLKWVKTPVR